MYNVHTFLCFFISLGLQQKSVTIIEKKITITRKQSLHLMYEIYVCASVLEKKYNILIYLHIKSNNSER